MICQRNLEIHSDAGFRREVSVDGEVDGKSIRGINVFRLGQQTGKSILCHLIDVLVGAVKVVVRSTFTAEAHGVIGAFDLGIVLATTFHEVQLGPLSLTESKRLTDEAGLCFDIECVTDAKNILLALQKRKHQEPCREELLGTSVVAEMQAHNWCREKTYVVRHT